MVKGFTTNHERFGELSALALVGQVSQAEYLELQRHLELCAACREEYFDFAAIVASQLPLLHLQPGLIENKRTGIGSFGRVSEVSSANPENLAHLAFRNESHKLNGSQKLWPLRVRLLQLSAAACLGLLVAGIFLGFGIYRHGARERSLAAELSALNVEAGGLREQIRSHQPVPTASAQAKEADGRVDRRSSNSELAVAALEAKLRASKVELQLLKDELKTSRNQENEILASAHEVQERLENTGQELAAMTTERDQALASAQSKQQQLAALALELTEARDSLERDKKLLAADRDIRDLMGARNLRIIDVMDVVDSKGRTRKPFGRVFLTEGKSLVFYAFDLDREPSSFQAAAFQGWGSQGRYTSAARSLGIFYRDNQNSNRWILRFDNPQVLAEIDSVFVTIEPPGGSSKPTGARLLPAYLKADLNHP